MSEHYEGCVPDVMKLIADTDAGEGIIGLTAAFNVMMTLDKAGLIVVQKPNYAFGYPTPDATPATGAKPKLSLVPKA